MPCKRELKQFVRFSKGFRKDTVDHCPASARYTRCCAMKLTGYFDESGTHGGSSLSVMAGFLGDSRQWHKFEKRAAKLFRRYRVDIFHSVDLKRSDRDFAGWSVDKKIEFIDDFYVIVNETLHSGHVAILTQLDWDFYQALHWPPKARRDSRYTVMFRGVMANILHLITTDPDWTGLKQPRLKMVLEAGHSNAQDVRRLYDFAFNFTKAGKALSGLEFRPKANSLPLAAADLLAYGAYLNETGGKMIGTAKKPMKSDAAYQQTIHRLMFNRETLLGLHQQALDIASKVLVPAASSPG
jgi:hypothetical protein